MAASRRQLGLLTCPGAPLRASNTDGTPTVHASGSLRNWLRGCVLRSAARAKASQKEMTTEHSALVARIERLRRLANSGGHHDYLEGCTYALVIVHDTLGDGHPLMAALRAALGRNDWPHSRAACKAVVNLFDQGGLTSPRLAIAHEIEGDLVELAQTQVALAEKDTDSIHKQVYLAVSAFLAGAALEDAMRRLCDAQTITYYAQRTSISKLQTALFQPSKQIEVISPSKNKQITALGDTRNKADHGKFSDITYAEVIAMVLGVRAFIDRHLP
jgi:hypothetical protein